MKSNLIKGLAGVMAAAMVVTALPATPVEAAAKQKTTATKITFSPASAKVDNGKSKSVKVKINAKAKAKVTVTLKSSNAKVAKLNKSKVTIAKGKKVSGAFKVTGKTAGKTAKITASFKNSKGKTVTKTMKVTVNKEAEPETPVVEELGIQSVVATTAGGNSGYKYIRVMFTSKVSGLDKSSFTVTDKATGQIYSVDKVDLSSDGLFADLEMKGDISVAGTQFLKANNTYVLTAKKGDKTAQSEFSIDDVAANVTIRAVDKDKKTITDSAGRPFIVPDSISVDYEEILGRTVTIKFNKDMTITNLIVKDERVIYGAFIADNGSGSDDAFIKDVVTGEKYYDQEYISDTSEITPTMLIEKIKDGTDCTYYYNFDSSLATDQGIAYGKLVLNATGTVKAMVVVDQWANSAAVNSGNVLVTKVVGNAVYGGTTPVDLKDYTIVKDGKAIAISDIAANDVVFYNTTYKFAEVYNNSSTGALEAVYNERFAFGGKTYDIKKNTYANLASKTRYIKENGGLTDVDNDYMNALKAGGKDVTVYFNRAGEPIYLVGDLGTVATNDKTIILTDDAQFYTQALTDYLRIKGSDGTGIKTYNVPIGDLKKIIKNDGTVYELGYDPYARTATDAQRDAAKDETNNDSFKAAKIDVDKAGTGTKKGNGEIGVYSKTNSKTQTPLSHYLEDIAANVGAVSLGARTAVTLTFNDKNEVIGLDFEDSTASNNVLKSGEAFKAGDSTITLNDGSKKLQISPSTPIYEYNNVDSVSDSTVSVTTYDKFSKATDKSKANQVHIYSADNKNVSFVVYDKDAIDADTDGQSTIEGVVSGVEYSADSDKKMVKISVLTGAKAEEQTFTTFAKDLKGLTATVVKGAIVDVKVAKDGITVNDVDLNKDIANVTYSGVTTNQKALLDVTDPDKSEFTLVDIKNDGTLNAAGAKTEIALANTVTPTIAKIDDKGEVSLIGFAELSTLSEDYVVRYSTLTGSYVDTIVVTREERTVKGVKNWAAYVTLNATETSTAVGTLKPTITASTQLTATGSEAKATQALSIIESAYTLSKVQDLSYADAAATTAKHLAGATNVSVNIDKCRNTGDTSDGTYVATDVITYTVSVTMGGYTKTFTNTIVIA